MKFRTDFVTNSSSSSFACYGVSKEDIEIADEVYLQIFEDLADDMEWDKSISDEEKIEYAKEVDDYDIYNRGALSAGGYDRDEIGITPYDLIKHFPEAKIGDTKKVVAEELNKQFGTKFTENDVSYFESGWYG